MMNFAVTGAQSILITFSLWIVEPRTTALPERYRDWLGRINVDIYDLSDRIIEVGANPRWTVLKEISPGPDRLTMLTQRMQSNMMHIESELIRIMNAQN